MTKQNQKSGDDTTNYQAGNNQYTAISDGSIYISNRKDPENIIKEIYNDLAKPGVRQVGKAIGTTVGLINFFLYPIKYQNDRSSLIYKSNFDKLRKKLESENISNITDIPPEIGKPLLEKLFYVSDEDLSQLFINLISRASKKDEMNLAHPNFVNMISSLSPDEARIIMHTKGKPIKYITPCENIIRSDGDYSHGIRNESNIYFTGLVDEIDIIFPENMYRYVINMISLGILGYPVNAEDTIENDGDFDVLRNTYRKEILDVFAIFSDGQKDLEEGIVVCENIVRDGLIEYTEFGKFFIKSVCY